MNNHKTLMLLLALIASAAFTQPDQMRRHLVGTFYPTDATIHGIRFGNWGSRPYEYAWVSSIIHLTDKKVIDLGTGIPSQYNWYEYVVKILNPAFYAGIDYDDRIRNELVSGKNFAMHHMSMANIQYPDNFFDVGLCISTYEHIPYETFIKAFQETHRVLKNDGLLVITLDEEWDANIPSNYYNGWNTLEQSLINKGLFQRTNRSFGLPEFLELIKDYFVLAQADAIVDAQQGIIYSKYDNYVYYDRVNRDNTLLNSGDSINSCVSYAVLKKVNC